MRVKVEIRRPTTRNMVYLHYLPNSIYFFFYFLNKSVFPFETKIPQISVFVRNQL